MTILDIVLAVKIVGTGLFCALPFMFLSAARLGPMLGVGGDAIPLVRLYGVAVFALLVGYSFGFSGVTGGGFPWGVVIMGIVSNGVGTLTMFLTGSVAKAKGMAALIGSISVALILCALNPALATAPL